MNNAPAEPSLAARFNRLVPRRKFLVLAFVLIAVGCRPSHQSPVLVRLVDQAPTEKAPPLVLGTDLEVGTEPTSLPVPRAGQLRDRLLVRAAGAPGAALMASWRFAGEAETPPGRLQPVFLDGGDSQRIYEVDLRDPEAGPGRRLAEIDLAAEGGKVVVAGASLEASGSPQRAADVDGLIVPSLPGAARLTLPLPAGLTGSAELSTRLAVDASAREHLRTARFRLRVETPEWSGVWLDERISRGQLPESGWLTFKRQVEIPEGARQVILETELEATDGSTLDPSLGLWGNPQLRFPAERSQGPNLLIIGIDTLRADMLGAYGDIRGLTPSMDRLAASSYRFADLTSPAPWTLPTFASLLTGLQPQTHGTGERVGNDPRLRNDMFTRLDRRFPTLAEVLSNAGLTTGGVFTSPFLGPIFGLHHGYDEYYGVDPEAGAGVAVDRTISWLENHREERFFFFLHLFDPHTPYEPPAPFCKSVARRLAPEFPGVPCYATRSPTSESFPASRRPWLRALYAAEVAYTDSEVGRLLDSLAELGLDRDTIVLLVSDHGEDLWERQDQKRRFGYHVVADHGNTLYRELVHVPAILHVPGRKAAVYSGAAETVDLFPTVLSLLSVEAPPTEGRNLERALEGSGIREPLRLAGALLFGDPRRSARKGPWKLIWRPGDTGPTELYNLEDDPGERLDLSGEQSEMVADLRRMAAAELRRRQELRARLLGSDRAAQVAPMSPEQVDRLRSLGYLQ